MAGISRYAVHRLIERGKIKPQYLTTGNGPYWTEKKAAELAPRLKALIAEPKR